MKGSKDSVDGHQIRLAQMRHCEDITRLIAKSVRGLSRYDYDLAIVEAALKGPWGLDTQLIIDGTYYLVFADGVFAACGGWSFRATLFGSDAESSRDSRQLDPSTDAARIRAFFVHPDYARQGIGTLLLKHCESAAVAAGFDRFTLGATSLGERLYRRHGYVAEAPVNYDLGDGLSMAVIPMTKLPF